MSIKTKSYTLGEEYFPYQGDYVLFSTVPSTHSITVESAKVNITAVNLRLFGREGALRLTDGADVNLTALGTNLFMPEAEYERAGIYVSESSKLTVHKNSESIIAVGTANSAGIGGECSYDGDSYTALDAGTVTVNGGTVFALSDDDGAGIGGAYLSSFRKIVINDGRVHAECLDNDGAGIGAGDDGNGGDIVINGGNITALSLDDDGAGIGGADSGHVDSITINGGVILVGTDDGASIGGGSDADSYGGKIVINGGTIHQHFDDGSDFYIGNDSANETGETDYNFVQINGGNIIGEDEIFPTPANKNDESVYPRTFKMPEELIGQTITVRFSDGTSFKSAVIGEDFTVYLPIGTHVVGAESWGHGHEYNTHRYNFDATCKKDGTNSYYCGYCGKTKTVTAGGTKLADTSKQFKDVSPKAWYKNAVDFAVTNGIFKGTSKTAFSPEDNMTRAQFVQVFANLAGVDTTNNKVSSGFKDVPKGKWYTAAVTWAAKNKVVNGIGGGKFAPEALVTREQMCVMLVNFVENYWGAKLPQEIKPAKFADDARISSWAESAVYKCAGARLVNGIGNNKFDPAGNATRAQGATLFTNFIKIV